MVYGMMKKDLLSIRIVVQRTVLFTVAIGGIVALLTLLPFLSSGISSAIPGAGFWLVPLFIALGAVSVATLYWQKAEETERLKYEFITVVAHKFRTPLTRIRWATESLLTRVDLPPDVIDRIQQMKEADLALIQLSNLLMDAARMDREDYTYAKSSLSLLPIVEEVLATYRGAAAEKHLTLSFTPPASVPDVRGDKERLASAVSVLVENAIAYTPPSGSIAIMLLGAPDQVRFQITDTGIGVTDQERHHIFKKFYRTDRARHADTEGVGLGLHMAKNIIERHRGTIGVESPGVGQGSTFWFTLPALPKGSEKTD
jgi:signal transduction histidine kinase